MRKAALSLLVAGALALGTATPAAARTSSGSSGLDLAFITFVVGSAVLITRDLPEIAANGTWHTLPERLEYRWLETLTSS